MKKYKKNVWENGKKKYFFGILYVEEMMCDELEAKFVQIAQRGI